VEEVLQVLPATEAAVIQVKEGNTMKSIIKLLPLLVGISFLFSGCYTMVWNPSQEFPSSENDSDSSEFYGTDYYGGYGGFYETPWWIGVPIYDNYPASATDQNRTKERETNRSSDTQNIRNTGGRGETTRDPGFINTPPVTQSGSGNSDGSTKKSPETRKDSGSTNSNSSSNNSNSSNSSNNSRSSSSSGSRDNSGSRNTDGGRR
jgi:hypothetical protein